MDTTVYTCVHFGKIKRKGSCKQNMYSVWMFRGACTIESRKCLGIV